MNDSVTKDSQIYKYHLTMRYVRSVSVKKWLFATLSIYHTKKCSKKNTCAPNE